MKKIALVAIFAFLFEMLIGCAVSTTPTPKPTRIPTMHPVAAETTQPVQVRKTFVCITDERLNFTSLFVYVQNQTNYVMIVDGESDTQLYHANKDKFLRNYKVPNTEVFEPAMFTFPEGLQVGVVCGVLMKYDNGRFLFAPLATINEVVDNAYRIATITLTGNVPMNKEPNYIQAQEVK